MESEIKVNRRQFLNTTTVLAAGLIGGQLPVLASSTDKLGFVLPRRRLGRTGLDVTMFCIGGAQLGGIDEKSVQERIEASIEGGCRFFETAQGYSKGRSEENFGKFLTPKYREQIVLGSKTVALDGATARKHLDESLSRLKTDYLDVYLMRWIKSPEDAEERLNNGVYDAMLEAKAAGKIKHIGFSGHSTPAANNYMIDRGLSELEVVLMPVNVVDPAYDSFIKHTIPKAVEKDIGIIAMKTFAGGSFFGGKAPFGRNAGALREAIVPEKLSLREAHHFVYSLPVSAITSGTKTVEHVRENISNARTFGEMTQQQRDKIHSRVQDIARTGEIEHYKHW